MDDVAREFKQLVSGIAVVVVVEENDDSTDLIKLSSCDHSIMIYWLLLCPINVVYVPLRIEKSTGKLKLDLACFAAVV